MPNCPRPDYDSDSITEDPEAQECPHEHGIIVCLDCSLPLPAPLPRGIELTGVDAPETVLRDYL